jgi:hypothetical protein
MNITDMEGIRMWDYTFGHAVRAADNHIVIPEIKFFDGGRKKREEIFIMFADETIFI